jgi:hypothetical protein
MEFLAMNKFSRLTEASLSLPFPILGEALPAFAPNLIAMDIEGAEPGTMRDACRLIARHRPGLAISVYHTPGHLWQIPLPPHDWNLSDRFYLRGHVHDSFDLMLYALPAESAA